MRDNNEIRSELIEIVKSYMKREKVYTYYAFVLDTDMNSDTDRMFEIYVPEFDIVTCAEGTGEDDLSIETAAREAIALEMAELDTNGKPIPFRTSFEASEVIDKEALESYGYETYDDVEIIQIYVSLLDVRRNVQTTTNIH